jgi:hypothetical protein
MSEERKQSRWVEVPKEVLEDLDVRAEGDDVEGFVQGFSYKVSPGGSAFLKITLAPATADTAVSNYAFKQGWPHK